MKIENLMAFIFVTVFFPGTLFAQATIESNVGANVTLGVDRDSNGLPLSARITLTPRNTASQGRYLAFATDEVAFIGGFTTIANVTNESYFICFVFKSENPDLFAVYANQFLRYGSEDYANGRFRIDVTRLDNGSSSCSSIAVSST